MIGDKLGEHGVYVGIVPRATYLDSIGSSRN